MATARKPRKTALKEVPKSSGSFSTAVGTDGFEGVHIAKGDTLIFRETNHALSGDFVAVKAPNYEPYIIGFLYRDDGRIRIESANPRFAYRPNEFDESQVEVLGVLTTVLRLRDRSFDLPQGGA